MAQGLISNIRRGCWIVTYNSIYLGYCDDNDPGIKEVKDKITTGSTGKLTLGHRFVDIEGPVKAQLREVTAAAIAALTPWNASDPNGPWMAHPPINVDKYLYAALLNFQPSDMVGQSNPHSLDINFVAAVPAAGMAGIYKRDGVKDDVMPVEFDIYPARTTLQSSGTVVKAFIGASSPITYAL